MTGSTERDDGLTEDGKAVAETVVRARGHVNVSATHASTFEVTSEEFLTPAGDCIVGIEADATPADVPDPFREACRSDDARITAVLEVRGEADDAGDESDHAERTATIAGWGHPDLSFADETSMVFRTSDYVDDRTVMVGADKAAGDLDRDLVNLLAAGAELRLVLRVA